MRTPTRYEARDGAVTWRVRFRNGSGRNAPQASETFDDETAANRFALLLEAIGPKAALEQLYADQDTTDRPTLDQLAEDHIKYLTGIDEGTRLDYERLWARTWSPLIGSRLVGPETLDKDDIKAAVNELEKRYAPKSMQNHRGLLSAILVRGIEKGYITINPAKGVKLSVVTVDPDAVDDEMTLLSMAEFDVLAAEFTGTYRTLVRFLVGTGCRWGETVVLRKRDLALDAAQPAVRIRRALKRSGDGARRIRGPKTKKSRRTVTLPRELLPELRALIDGKGADDLVFTGLRGGMIAHRNFWSWQWRPGIFRAQRCAAHFDKACRCGSGRPKTCPSHPGLMLPEPCNCPGTLPFYVRIHDLRHTHASWLLAAGIPIHVVSRRLGHESIQTTVDTYGHLLPDAQIAAARAADAAFAELDGAEAAAVMQRELAGLDQLMGFLAGDDELPPEVVAALRARGWTPPALALEA